MTVDKNHTKLNFVNPAYIFRRTLDCCNGLLLQLVMFEWDDEKNAVNHQKHGVFFEDILPIFDLAEADGLLVEDNRRDYGESRCVLLCPFRGKIYHVTFTRRGERIRLISARRANRKEVQDYERREHH